MPQVKQVDIKAIFIKAGGHTHPMVKTIICRPEVKQDSFTVGNMGSREQRKISY